MTPGQRWTALIALLYVIAVVNFGAPPRTVLAEMGPDAAKPLRGVPLPGETLSARPVDRAVTAYAVVPPYGPPGEAAEPQAAEEEAVSPSLAAEPPRIAVAVGSTSPSGVPGRDDAAMAAAFLTTASFEHTVVPIGPDLGATCEQLSAAGDVVVASDGLGVLNDCLLAAGVTVVAFDAGGDVQPSPGSGQVVSTRRGVEASLVDLGRWGVSGGVLRGKVGLVGTASEKLAIERAAAVLKRSGVDLVASAFIADGPDASATVGDGVREFVSKGVEVVLFATGVAQQRQWGAQHRVLASGVRFVVSDVADGVRAEVYPPVFDGALAHTSLRVPWFARDHGETPLQVACRQRWEAHIGGPMAPGEATRVFAWCQHIELVEVALRAASEDVSFIDAIRSTTLQSPLTSDLAALPDGGWGPTADAVLVWRSSCTCWTEHRPFQRRA